jgi:hypothetical protein
VIEPLLTFVLVCLSTAFICTSVKEDEDPRLVLGTFRLFGVMGGGIAAFAVVVQVLTWIAS